MVLSESIEHQIKDEIAGQQLPSDFFISVVDYLQPLASQVNSVVDALPNAQASLLGIQGTQGSGKSTCAEFLRQLLEAQFDKHVVVISLDDFYLTKQQRETLAATRHPLLITRGPPGTHDLSLLEDSIRSLRKLKLGETIEIPRFDKAADDRADKKKWQRVSNKVDIIIIEGWCLGVPPQKDSDLSASINTLERNEDHDLSWRKLVNSNLRFEYQQFNAMLDHLIVLQAPSFQCVYQWRLLQEQKLARAVGLEASSSSNAIQSETELTRFINHFERLTRHALGIMPGIADWVLWLAQDHAFLRLETNSKHKT